jgi:hypothetical protein
VVTAVVSASHSAVAAGQARVVGDRPARAPGRALVNVAEHTAARVDEEFQAGPLSRVHGAHRLC